MARLSKRETKARQSLYEMSYDYLSDNFHKFKDSTKLRVAISMLQIFNKDDSKTKEEQHIHITNITNLIRDVNQECLSSENRVESVLGENGNGNGHAHN